MTRTLIIGHLHNPSLKYNGQLMGLGRHCTGQYMLGYAERSPLITPAILPIKRSGPITLFYFGPMIIFYFRPMIIFYFGPIIIIFFGPVIILYLGQ